MTYSKGRWDEDFHDDINYGNRFSDDYFFISEDDSLNNNKESRTS